MYLFFLAAFTELAVTLLLLLLLEQDWKEMVHDPEVGAIVVGSPTPFHAEQIIEAANLGKHIFCEKVRYGMIYNMRWDGMRFLCSFFSCLCMHRCLHVSSFVSLIFFMNLCMRPCVSLPSFLPCFCVHMRVSCPFICIYFVFINYYFFGICACIDVCVSLPCPSFLACLRVHVRVSILFPSMLSVI